MAYFSKCCEFTGMVQKRLTLRRVLFFISLILLIPFCFKPTPIEAYIGKFSKTNYIEREKGIIERYGLFVNDILNIFMAEYQSVLIKSLNYGDKIAFINKNGNDFRNIICIQVETLDANAINFKYKEKYIVPFLHGLSLNSVYYPYMLTCPSAWGTSDAGFAVINSLMPIKDFPFYRLSEYNYPNSFLKQLSNSGFDVLAFHNNYGRFFNRKETFAKMGFQDFYDIDKMKLKEYGWGAKDEDVFNFVKDKLKGQKQSFMYYIITMSSHEPFNNVRLYYSNKYYDDIEERIARDYFNSISYADKALQEFISFVKNNIPDTYIFIFGDHAFYSESHMFKHAAAYNHYPIMAVPLIIVTPENKKYAENSKAASMLDMGLTVLKASNVSFEISAKGVDLLDFPVQENGIAVSHGNKGHRNAIFKEFYDLEHKEER